MYDRHGSASSNRKQFDFNCLRYVAGSITKLDDLDKRWKLDNLYCSSAFSIPQPGTFGDSPRNVLFGPRSHQLNANFTRDVRLPGNRNVSIVATATNLLNTVNYAGLDTNVNSSTFGEITSVRPLRTIRFNLRFRF